ncbi:MAG TPA: glycosyltransferase family 39 protein, partial [Methyloceanibacter sp.]|nr:glycosyltransferase family 39 protein [Methyloceanibacter sp.]
MTALTAHKAAHPALLRSWREPVWRDQDYWPWLLVILGAILVIRLLALYFAKTDLFFDEAQYWSWSRDLAFGYFSKPPLIAWLIRLSTEICGSAEWCVRAPSPILYTITSIFLFLAARALYGARVGFWSAVVFATLPAASFSSLLISTDVPLILCWTLAFYGWVRLIDTRKLGFAVLIGASIGLGLLAKYAAAYFVLCVAIDAWRDPRARDALRGGRGLVALAIALLFLAPNLAWNASHSFATFSHTAQNAGWKGLPFNLGDALEFLGSQFAVFGPILFAVLVVVAWRAFRRGCEQPECRLLAFSVPVILLLVVQALLSRALANWAAAAYPAATILVTAALLRDWPRLFRISLWLHIGVGLVITIAPLFAPRITALTGPEWNPYARVIGWRDLAESTRRLAEAQGAKTVLADNREMTAELLYYLRDSSLPIAIWFREDVPRNHFEMTRPFTKASPDPVLYVTLNRTSSVLKRFDSAEVIGEQAFPTDAAPVRDAR